MRKERCSDSPLAPENHLLHHFANSLSLSLSPSLHALPHMSEECRGGGGEEALFVQGSHVSRSGYHCAFPSPNCIICESSLFSAAFLCLVVAFCFLLRRLFVLLGCSFCPGPTSVLSTLSLSLSRLIHEGLHPVFPDPCSCLHSTFSQFPQSASSTQC